MDVLLSGELHQLDGVPNMEVFRRDRNVMLSQRHLNQDVISATTGSETPITQALHLDQLLALRL
jgi:hypothetical protein